MKKIRIARIVTIPEAFVHILQVIKILNSQNVEIDLISSDGKYKEVLREKLGMTLKPLKIERDIRVVSDVISLIKLMIVFASNRYQIVHSSTPKAGLLTAIAGIVTFRPIRLHTFTGQRWATLTGFKRKLLMWLDRLIIVLNTKCYADSPSQIQYLIEAGVAKEGEVECLNLGSYGGIDIERFNAERFPDAREKLIQEAEIANDAVILLFIGRVTRDKGIAELVTSFLQARNQNQKLELVLVGPFEEKLDILPNETLSLIKNSKYIHHLGFKTNPEFYFAGADIFCLPSYREGFGTVVLEAAASGLCTIGTKIPGLVDSIVDGETGLLVELKNTDELSKAMIELASNQKLREKLSMNALKRARKEFDSSFLARLQWEEYQKLLKK